MVANCPFTPVVTNTVVKDSGTLVILTPKELVVVKVMGAVRENRWLEGEVAERVTLVECFETETPGPALDGEAGGVVEPPPVLVLVILSAVVDTTGSPLVDGGGLVPVDDAGEVGEEEDVVVLPVLERGGGGVVEDGGRGAAVVDKDAVAMVKLRTPVSVKDVTCGLEAVVPVEDIGGGPLGDERGRVV